MDLTRIAAILFVVGLAVATTAAWLTNWLFGLFMLGVSLAVIGASSGGES
ncbi:MAG TPA: hypothetical protein VF377_03965 [Acidimicrobiia bacterium]|jgi:hypothetical protein|nr:hypothetical protein [Glycomyces sp.]